MPPSRTNHSTSGASRRRDRQEDESEEEAQPTQNGATQGSTQKGGLSEPDLKRKAGQLVRLALFSEYKRQVIRRDFITKEVIPKTPRAFPQVLARAQIILRQTFGMELVELRSKNQGEAVLALIGDGGEGSTQNGNQAAATQSRKGKGRARNDGEDEEDEAEDDNEAGEGQRKRAKGTTGPKSYILRSTLPQTIISAMSAPNPLPMFNAHGERINDPNGHGEDGNPYEPEGTNDSGSLIRLEKADGTVTGGVGLLGIRTVILCLILCLGRVVNDDHLHALLRRLNLERDTVLPSPSIDGKEGDLTLDKFLDKLASQNYLEKVKVPGGDQPTFEWRWGNREAEFSEKAAAAFIEKIFFNDHEDSDSEDEQASRTRGGGRREEPPRDRAAEKEKARKKLRDDIGKAAGGALTGVDLE